MPLGGRPEPGWIAIGSHAAQRAPGLMCGALLNSADKFLEIIDWIFPVELELENPNP